jgi:hypothetical protein
LTTDQIAGWEAFNVLEPVGSYKQDFLFAQLCDLINVLAHAYGGQKAESKLLDFMPWWLKQYFKESGQDKKQSLEDMKARLMIWAKGHNKAEARRQAKRGK